MPLPRFPPALTLLRRRFPRFRGLTSTVPSPRGPNVPATAAAAAAPAPPPPPGLHYFPTALTPSESTLLAGEATAALARRKYDANHYDAVILDYREAQLSLPRWSPASREVLTRLMRVVDEAVGVDGIKRRPVEWMPPHVIDLAPVKGRIDAHVDSVKHGGDVVACVSLLSQRRLFLSEPSTPGRAGRVVFEMDLPPGSLYILSGFARYELAHAISAGPERRMSIVLRDEPEKPAWAALAGFKKP